MTEPCFFFYRSRCSQCGRADDDVNLIRPQPPELFLTQLMVYEIPDFFRNLFATPWHMALWLTDIALLVFYVALLRGWF